MPLPNTATRIARRPWVHALSQNALGSAVTITLADGWVFPATASDVGEYPNLREAYENTKRMHVSRMEHLYSHARYRAGWLFVRKSTCLEWQRVGRFPTADAAQQYASTAYAIATLEQPS